MLKLEVEVRRQEMDRARDILGVRQDWLGFVDSGWPEGDPKPPLPEGCFALVPLAEAAAPLVRLIREFRPHVVTTYDERGGYPHPDHVKCHEISVAAFPEGHPESDFSLRREIENLKRKADAGATRAITQFVFDNAVYLRFVDRAEAAGIELLLVGTGLDIAAIDPALRGWLKEVGVGLDVMQTGAAARTYNILVAENRKVAAALIAVENAR